MRTGHRTVRLLLTAVLAAGLVGSAPGGALAASDNFPAVMNLPNGWLPEGIAIGPGKQAWFGSRADGDIYQLDLKTGAGEVISQGPGTPAVGLKSDRGQRLFVAGGPAGTARVVDVETGATLMTYQLATAGASFINDVVLTRDAAWFTDSQHAVLYKLPLGAGHALPAPGDVETLPLIGGWTQVPGFNANGIIQTPDHQALLVVNSTTGLLYRVDPETGVATAVDLGATSLSSGDGLLLKGTTVYVVRNVLNQVAVLTLDPAAAAGTLERVITSSHFDVPTTVARFGSRLYLPNARFTTPPTPDTTYTVVQVPANVA